MQEDPQPGPGRTRPRNRSSVQPRAPIFPERRAGAGWFFGVRHDW